MSSEGSKAQFTTDLVGFLLAANGICSAAWNFIDERVLRVLTGPVSGLVGLVVYVFQGRLNGEGFDEAWLRFQVLLFCSQGLLFSGLVSLLGKNPLNALFGHALAPAAVVAWLYLRLII